MGSPGGVVVGSHVGAWWMTKVGSNQLWFCAEGACGVVWSVEWLAGCIGASAKQDF